MKFLKGIGWFFIPYIMLPFQWKKIGKIGKTIGTVWALFSLLMALGWHSNPQPSTATTSAPAKQETLKLNDQAKQQADANATKLKAEQEAKAKADADKKAKEEADAKAKAEAQAKADAEAKAKAEYAIQHPDWNTNDMYATTNGNIPLAVRLLKDAGDVTKTATSPDPIAVQKAPWNYYGKPVKLTGTVAIVQDYPPSSDSAILMGGTASEIVLVTDDGAFIDSLLSVSSGKVKIGDSVTVFGFPVGLVEATNKLGGKTTELAIVGNKYKTNQ